MLLEAAAKFITNGTFELHIIGDGPQRALLEAMVDRLGIRSGVHFHGWVPHIKVQDTLRTCDFLALPSIKEFGGGVVVESMALGVAPIVADYAGPSDLVDDNTGIRVSFHDEKSLVEGMEDAFRFIIHSPHILDTLGTAGRKKVLEKLTWEAKASQIIAVYDAVLSGTKNLTFLDYDCDDRPARVVVANPDSHSGCSQS